MGHQVYAPFDFTASVRVSLREQAPDELVLPGPGNTLGAICGQILGFDRWRGVRCRADFDTLQPVFGTARVMDAASMGVPSTCETSARDRPT